jgi:hypothetical protein
MPLQMSFDSAPPVQPGKLLFSLDVPGRLSSWNEILGMEQWARYKHKQELAGVFLSALRRTAADCSMRTTSAKSTWLTYADTLVSYLRTRQEKRKLRLRNKKLARGNQSLPGLKSSKPSKVPF